MSTVLFMGGLFNYVDPIFSLPIYFWLWFFTLIMAGLVWLGFRYGKWAQFGPLQGLYWEFKAGGNAGFIFDENLIGEFVTERVAKCIFDYSTWDYELPSFGLPFLTALYRKYIFYYPQAFIDNASPYPWFILKWGKANLDVQIARKLQGGEWERSPSVVCGGVPVDIIVDTDNWTIKRSVQHKAIEREALAWNELHPDDQIHSYSKFQRKLLANDIICPEVKKEAMVSWTRVDAGFTIDMEATEYTGKIIQVSEQEYSADQINMNRLGWGILLGGIGFAIFLLVIRLIMHFVK